MRKKNRVVVTGYGMVTPIGKNSRESFENARNGDRGSVSCARLKPKDCRAA